MMQIRSRKQLKLKQYVAKAVRLGNKCTDQIEKEDCQGKKIAIKKLRKQTKGRDNKTG